TTSGVPTPYGTWYKNFRQQYLYTASDLIANGMVPGAIYALAFNVQTLNNCSPMPNYRIRMKTTAQTELTTTFEVGDYTQVWHHPSFLPEVGWNMHVFNAPFFWDGASNIIVDILTDLIPGAYTQNAGVYYSPTAYVSSLRYQSDSAAADAATTGTTASNRSNTRFYLNVEDTGSLTGTVTENGTPLNNVTITIEETVFSTTTNASGVYNFSHAPVGTHTVTASKTGYTPVSHSVTIVADEQSTLNFAMVGTPDISISDTQWNFGDVNLGGSSVKSFSITNTGGGILGIQSISISGSPTFSLAALPTFPASIGNEESITFDAVFTPNALSEFTATITITDDQGTRYVLGNSLGSASRSNRSTNTREVHTIALTGNGVNVITIGDGSQTAYIPIDFWYKNSIFETIYTNAELNNFVGMITGIKFYNSFNAEVTNKPIKIYLGTTTQSNLEAGWIPSTDLTLVFDEVVSYPTGENVINFEFDTPFMYLDGANLVMMVHRPMDTEYLSSKYFKTQTVGTNRSRKLQSDSTEFDPANPDAGTLSGQFPKTTFTVIPGGVGHITGTVTTASSAPLEGVQVNIEGSTYSTTTDQNGQFLIPNVLPGNYTAVFSRHGYVTQTAEIVLEEDETEVLNITMNLMAQVTVTGTILASDTAAGIAGAAITLTGYENYSASSIANGTFSFPAVFANQSYEYTISAAGYTSESGTIAVGASNYAMGNITLAEIAYAPNRVSAELSDTFDSVELSWFAPDPNALEITESFEGTFPPAEWSQVITDNGPANTVNVYPTWCSFGAVNVSPVGLIAPTDGIKQAGLWWSTNHQDEWLKTPAFNCPPDGFLRFDTFAPMGSTHGDHYYVKVSVNGGNTWSVLWDASSQAEGTNVYDAPITVDLAQFSGQQIMLAFHAEDPASNDGLWYTWFIDNIYIGNFVDVVRFAENDTPSRSISSPERSTSSIAQESFYRDLRDVSFRGIDSGSLGSSQAEPHIRQNTRALT
ncbi:MAG TPA: carboxypeptidase regulatory-like domain-containing protein, partial [Candidatus Cloacimonadota bacterium]|nr:carboxypeptidase regulatory-like domain-containing protein [Candidatus Cloacimonadota bacterium]